MIDVSNYQRERADAERFYSQIGKVLCPVFNALVYFTSEGFNHLIYKSNRTERERSVQMMKFRLLPRVKKLLEICTIYQEYEEGLQEFQVKRHKTRVIETKVVRYWGIIAILEGMNFKVIVRQVGDNGQKHFWSVIPDWITNQYRDLKLISLMKGDPKDA